MELADIGHPRKMAEGVLKLVPGITFPIPIDDIALALDIRAIEDFETEAFEGALLTNESKSNASILVRSGIIEPRRRFTIGHELGHYLMPLHFPPGDGFRCTQQDMREQEKPGVSGRPQWEAQANAFASELLMPTSEYRRRLKAAGGASIEAILSLSDAFGVSRIACGIAMLRMADSPLALVAAKEGIIKSVYPSREFPRLGLKVGMKIPKASIAAVKTGTEDSVSDCEPIDPCHWVVQEIEGLELYEQALFQVEGWTLTLLTAEVPDEDESDE